MLLSSEKGVRRDGDAVLRPRKPWTPYVQDFLHFLASHGFPAPRVIENQEFEYPSNPTA